jgi:hypothetical protein
LTAANSSVSGTATFTGLTASQAVFTNSTKDLVSVATTGSGNVVLATSPTLVTPDLGVASATSLTTTGSITAPSIAQSRGSFTTASTIVIPLPTNSNIQIRLSFTISITASNAIISGNTLANGTGTNLPAIEAQETYTRRTTSTTVVNTSAGTIILDGSNNTVSLVTINMDTSKSGLTPRLPYSTDGVYSTSASGTTKLAGSGYITSTALSIVITPSAGTVTGTWSIQGY